VLELLGALVPDEEELGGGADGGVPVPNADAPRYGALLAAGDWPVPEGVVGATPGAGSTGSSGLVIGLAATPFGDSGCRTAVGVDAAALLVEL
jgi:hypothetical protein